MSWTGSSIGIYADAKCEKALTNGGTYNASTFFVKGLSVGTSTITVTTTDGEMKATCAVTVKEKVTETEKQPETKTDTTPTTATQTTQVEQPITIAKTPASVKAKAKKNKVTVSWKKIKKNKKTKALRAQIKAIEVQYATDVNFTQNVGSKTVKKGKTKAVLKLQRKTVYYVRVRYLGADGVSNWSKTKRVKTK